MSVVNPGAPFPVTGTVADGSAVAAGDAPVLIAGTDGTNVQTISTDTSGRIVVAPSGVSASVKGFADGTIVRASTAQVAVISTTYTEQSTDAQRSFVSANANDTAAGTGARTVEVIYYTSTGAGPYTETVTLNGTTAVNTVATDICFIEHIFVRSVGSTGSNVGIISLKAATAGGGATIWSVAATANQTYGAHHYVATGKTCYITGVAAGISGTGDTASVLVRAIDIPVANKPDLQISDILRVTLGGEAIRSYGTPIDVAGPARITAYVQPDSTSSRTYQASFDFYEE